MKRFLTFLGAIFMAGSVVCAQEADSTVLQQMSLSNEEQGLDVVDYIPNVSLDTRFGYNRTFPGSIGGFGGDGLYLDISGKISKGFSYSLNQRLTTDPGESFFDATNWLTLSYEVNNFSFTAGKDALLVGSFEYDAYDLDSYADMNSRFYNAISCWQWGLSASWTNDSETSTLIAQVANSPFAANPFEDNLYAYGVAWRGTWDSYESYWSFGMWEYQTGRFVKSVNLGNMFYAGNFSLMLDGMLRGAKLKDLLRDVTVSVQPSYEFCDRFRLFGKFGWERNGMIQPYDFSGEYAFDGEEEYSDELPDVALPPKDYLFYGAGLEFYPVKNYKDLRLHAAWSSNNETNLHAVTVGLTWKMNLTRGVKWLVDKVQQGKK